MCAQSADDTAATIVRIPGVCSGYAHIAGTKLPVWAIVSYMSNSSIDEVIKGFPYLSKQAIEAAMDYYRNHKDEVDNDQRDSEAA